MVKPMVSQLVNQLVNQLVDQAAVNPLAGDRPFLKHFRLAAAATWAGVSIASSLAAWASFVPLAQAQEQSHDRQPSASIPVQIELSPSPVISDPQGFPALQPLPPVPAPSSDGRADTIGQDSIGQIDTQRPVLPFSDVPPDHWAYEALLYLSTGGRSPRSVPQP
ncbi:hypothetical protein HNI00_13405 [Thermoleptolyngbya oregonensis NK1-22]|uniref:Uncharacterized protein n=1 Tax=Thermoleptolyngbya oregonensis NK1-22 TaxID=2547457 RepID=A0AA97BA91_9CYAN|nr:hypothetical protein [Thermoleptolyngbya oregonensis]WOB44035.1 hypothetical protein HNI00_13405 [Thermoleptolyngbya oregonensis NK1-22]